MSAEIHENDVVQLGSNKPAWWGFQQGHLWQGRLSNSRVFVEGTGAREMWETPVITPDEGLNVEGYKAIVGRYSNGNVTPLSVVGEDYGLLRDEEFFSILDGVYGGRAVVETAGTLRNGRRVWSLVARENHSVNGDDVSTYDLWVNRHDGSGCFELHRTNVRVVCQNTWNTAIGNGRNRVFGVRHTRNIKSYIGDALRLLSAVDTAEKVEMDKLRRMASTPMLLSDAEAFFDTLLGVDRAQPVGTRTSNQHRELVSLFTRGTGNKGETRFDAFNAVTEFVDHRRTFRVTGGRSADEARFETVLLGTGDAMKARAFDLLAVNA